MKRLEEICIFIRNGLNIKNDKSKKGIPVTRIETISNGIIDINKTGYANIFDDKYIDYYLRQDDILMSHINSLKHLGKVGYCYYDMKIIHGMNLLNIRVNPNNVYPKYLYYYFKSNNFKIKLNKISKQSVNQSSFSISDLKKIRIEIIDLERQKLIVTKLDKVVEVISIRKKQIEELNNLIKSQFVEMFGIPFLNNKNWTMGIIKELVREVKYGTSKPANGGKYKYLRMNNITYEGKLDLNEMKYIDIEKDDKEKYVIKKGDILFNRTNSKELVGKTCVFDVEEEMIIAGFIIRVRVNDFANPYFISEYLNTVYLKDKLRNMCKDASGQSNINAKELQNIKIYIPPITLQNQFSEIVKQIDKQKFKIEKSLKEIQELYESLMEKYFG